MNPNAMKQQKDTTSLVVFAFLSGFTLSRMLYAPETVSWLTWISVVMTTGMTVIGVITFRKRKYVAELGDQSEETRDA